MHGCTLCSQCETCFPAGHCSTHPLLLVAQSLQPVLLAVQGLLGNLAGQLLQIIDRHGWGRAPGCMRRCQAVQAALALKVACRTLLLGCTWSWHDSGNQRAYQDSRKGPCPDVGADSNYSVTQASSRQRCSQRYHPCKDLGGGASARLA